MPKPPAVVTVGRTVQSIDWVIKYLKMVRRSVGGRKAVDARVQRRAPGVVPPWDVDCASPRHAGVIDVPNALDACIATLEQLRRSFVHLPPRHPLA
jgi:hypothetical protein